jgi:hypothetical protein
LWGFETRGIMGLRGGGGCRQKREEDKKGLFLQQEGSHKGVPVCVKKGVWILLSMVKFVVTYR